MKTEKHYTYTVYESSGMEESNHTSTYGLKLCNESEEYVLFDDITTNRKLLEGIASLLQENGSFRPEQASALIKALVDSDFFIT